MTHKSRPPEGSASLDLRKVEFPSDALSIKRLRQLFPQDFDRDEPWEDGSCVFFSPGSPRCDQQLEQLNTLLMLERIVVQAAFHLQRGKEESFDPNQLKDIKDYKQRLEHHYQEFKLADSPETARLLVQEVEDEGIRQARKVDGRSL